MTPTEDQFIQGEPLAYTGLDGHPYTARYRRDLGVRYVDVRDATGRKTTNSIMSETQARTFYVNAAREVL